MIHFVSRGRGAEFGVRRGGIHCSFKTGKLESEESSVERTNETAGVQKLLVAPWQGESCIGGWGGQRKDGEGRGGVLENER